MDFLKFKEKIKKEYKELNKSMWIEVDVPSDQEILMQYLALLVITRHKIELAAKHDRARRGGNEGNQI